MKRKHMILMLTGFCLSLLLAGACTGAKKKQALNPPKADLVLSRAAQCDAAFAQLPLGAVRAASWLERQLRLQAEHITGDFESLCPDVQTEGEDRSGWLGGSGEAWERGPYYVKGLVALAYTLSDDVLIAKCQRWIDAAIESQTESGAFGPYADTPDKLDWWSLMPMVSAIEYYYDATAETKADPRVIPFLEKYFAFQAKALNKKPLTDWAKARAGDNIDSIYWLYLKNGDESLLRLCRRMYAQTDWKTIYTEDRWSGTYHIVNTHQSFKLLPLMYAITGEQDYLKSYYKGLLYLDVESGRADGMSNGDELTGTISATCGTETCAVAERMLSDEIALRITGDSSIADHLELIAYNVWPSQLTEQITGQVYFTMQNQVTAVLGPHGFSSDGGDRAVYGTPGGYPCCSCNFHMGWPLFVSSMWMRTTDGGIAAGAYGPNEVTFTGGGAQVRIVQETDYPFRNTVNLTIHMEGACTFPIYLRVPEWCSTPEVYVNGVQQALPAGDGYFCLQASWCDNDRIQLVFPETIKASYSENNSVFVRRGALLYTLGLAENTEKIDYNPNQWTLTEKYTSVNLTPAEDWSYALSDFDIHNAETFFTVSEREIKTDMTFAKEQAPIVLQGKAVLVKDWGLREDQVAQRVPLSPISPEQCEGEIVEVALIPYGFARLRVTLLPWTGDTPVYFTPDETDSDIMTFYRVTVPYTGEEGATAMSLIQRPVQLTYTAPEDMTAKLFINGEEMDTLRLKKNENIYVSEALRIDPSKYNLVELRTAEDGENLRNLSGVSLCFGEAEAYGICLEAEYAELSGSAYKSGAYVAGIDDTGSSLHFPSIRIPSAGVWTVRVYYAAAAGKATHTLLLDGQPCGVISYAATDRWGVFRNDTYAELTITAEAGSHSFTILKAASDIGFAELERIELIQIKDA